MLDPLVGLSGYYSAGMEYLPPPINGYYPYLLRAPIGVIPTGNHLDVIESPVLLLVKTSDNAGVNGYLLEHGLRSIGKENHTCEIKEYLSGGDRKALLISSQNFRFIQDYEIRKIVLSEQSRISTYFPLRNVQIPWILLLDTQEYELYKDLGLNEVDEIEISTDGVKIVNEVLPVITLKRL